MNRHYIISNSEILFAEKKLAGEAGIFMVEIHIPRKFLPRINELNKPAQLVHCLVKRLPKYGFPSKFFVMPPWSQ